MTDLREVVVVEVAVLSVSADHSTILHATKHVVAIQIHRAPDLDGGLPNHLRKVARHSSVAPTRLVIVVGLLLCVPSSERIHVALVL